MESIPLSPQTSEEAMFKIECYCEDAKLPKVKWALDGLVFNLTDKPVRNAEVKNGTVKSNNKMNATDTLIHVLKKHKKKRFDLDNARIIMSDYGFNPKGVYTMLNGLTKRKRIVRVGKGQYEVK